MKKQNRKHYQRRLDRKIEGTVLARLTDGELMQKAKELNTATYENLQNPTEGDYMVAKLLGYDGPPRHLKVVK